MRDAALPRARSGGLDAGDALDRRHGGRADEVQPAVVLADRTRTQRDVVLGGADDSPAAAGAREEGRAAAGRRREAALHPLVQRLAAAAGHARSRGRVRRARARGLRHDRGRAPDVVQSAATGAAAAGLGRTRHRREDQHHGRRGQASRGWRARRGRHLRPQRRPRIREQSRSQCLVVRRWMVPDRRPGLPRRERLSHADRTPEGDDQSRRREDLSARDRRGPARASGGGRGRLLRRPAQRVGRGSRCGGDAERRGHRGRTARLLQGAARRVQASEADSHHDRHPAHRHRQDPASRGRTSVRPQTT